MNGPVLEILIIVLLVVANGAFAMAEIAIVSARKARLQQMADAGIGQARAALELAINPNEFLATTQIGITLVGILAGAFGGATIAEELALRLNDIPSLARYGETIAVGIVVLVITYLSLIVGELVPKRMGLSNAERIASAVAGPMRVLSAISSPVVRLLGFSTDIVIRVLGVKPSGEPSITPEEIKILIAQGRESGVFEESEQDMIEGVLRLDERRVGAFMTPRAQIAWFEIEDSPEQIQRTFSSRPHSRYPVGRDSLDHVLGIVRAQDLLGQCLAGQPLDLKALLRPPLIVPESMRALGVLEILRRERTHVALITDEYGSIQGMVTHNDILEDIAGHIPSSGEPAEPQATPREDGSWLLDGLLQIDELKEIFSIARLPDEERHLYQTVGGFVMTRIGSIPAAGQAFEWGALRFEVLDMDGNRVDKVLVTPRRAKDGENAQ